MDRTIENKFFEAFKWGGVVDKCIKWVRLTYNLPSMKPRASTKKREETLEQRKTREKFERYYRETLPKEILEATAAFDDTIIKYMESPLMDEIEENLNSCTTETQKERYLFSLLKPFGENGCGIARVYNPTAEVNRLKERIRGLEKNKAFWETRQDKDAIAQIEACNEFCQDYQEQIKWEIYVYRRFLELPYSDKCKEGGNVEYCLCVFVDIMRKFANRLDALLLTYGIDLMRLQRESGFYLKGYREITDVEPYIGSFELAQRYIDALPEQQPEQPEKAPEGAVILPDVNNNEAKKTRGRGRPKETFKDKLIGDAEGEKLQKLHLLIDGRKGKAVSLVILASIKKGWLIEKPTFTQVKDEFGDIGTQQGFANYLDENKFTKEELEGAINSLV